MSETYQQMRLRHEEEIRIATEQHAIRMQAMKERHFSEMMQVANPGVSVTYNEQHEEKGV